MPTRSLALAVTSLVLSTAALSAPGPAAAQRSGSLRAEQRIRFTAPSAGFPGQVGATVIQSRGDSVVLQVYGTQRTLALASLQDVSVSRGHGPRGKWAAFGAAVGTVAGITGAEAIKIGSWHHKHYVTFQQCTSDGSCGYFYRLVNTPYPRKRYVAITALGTVTGAVAGYVLPRDRWLPLGLSASAGPSGSGVRLAFSLRR
jgi:hypothetical protein